jgi:hypothetical protein
VRRIALIALVLISGRLSNAQEVDSSTTASVAIASIVPAALISAGVVLNYEAFWKNADAVAFHISNDPPYSMHVDKLSHAYLSMGVSDGIRGAYRMAGVTPTTSSWLGAGLSVATGLVIELEDARHGNDPQYGFSPGDVGADIVGASLPLLQHYYPAFERVSMKLSVWPSDAHSAYNTIIDDYESQYYWITYNPHDILPTPRWLNVAVGYSAENLNAVSWLPSRAGKQPAARLFIAPDIDLAGLPIEGAFWKSFTRVMRYIRIPLPAIEVSPRLKFWWLR